MATEQECFLKAILENPDEDTHRLAYADWLEERGGSDRSDRGRADRNRAEFIRVQCELSARNPEAKSPVWCSASSKPEMVHGIFDEQTRMGCTCEWCELTRRRDKCCFRRSHGMPNLLLWEVESTHPAYESVGYRPNSEIGVRFRRGFPSCITIEVRDFNRIGNGLFAVNPIEEFRLISIFVGAVCRVEIDAPKDGYGWQAYYFANERESYETMNGWDDREEVIPGIVRDLERHLHGNRFYPDPPQLTFPHP